MFLVNVYVFFSDVVQDRGDECLECFVSDGLFLPVIQEDIGLMNTIFIRMFIWLNQENKPIDPFETVI